MTLNVMVITPHRNLIVGVRSNQGVRWFGRSKEDPGGCCQIKANQSRKTEEPAVSGRKLAPLGKGSGAVKFEVFAAVKMTFLVEAIVD